MSLSGMHPELECVQAQALRSLSQQIQQGVSAAQIRRMVLPSQLMRLQETLEKGDAQAISFIMRDVAGEAVSLTAGASIQGGAAMEALSLAQAQCLLDLRGKREHREAKTMPALASMMAAHRESLINWVQCGRAGSDIGNPVVVHDSDLTRIGQEFLTDPILRQSAIGVFVATTAVIEAGLTLFTSNHL